MTSVRTALPAGVLLVATAPLLGRLVPLPDPHFMLVVILLIAAATAFAMSEGLVRIRPADTTGFVSSALAVALAAAVATGFTAGARGWPAPAPLAWVLAALSWMLLGIVAQVVHPKPALPVGGALSLPVGVLVSARTAVGIAWRDQEGTIRRQRIPGASLLRAIGALIGRSVITPLRNGQRPRWFSLRRLHGAEHQVMVAAWDGCPTDDDTLAGISPITPRCGGTLLALAVPLTLVAAVFAPNGPAGWAGAAWAAAATVTIRAAAVSSPPLRWLLTPGLWLQRLTTAAPTAVELTAAREALAAALQEPPQ